MSGLLVFGAPCHAQQTVGWGRLLNNDLLGDLHDRWHSGSYAVSALRGPVWLGTLPGQLGALVEFRISGAILASADLQHPALDDRRYAAPLSLGLRSHVAWAGLQASLGADLVATGPQTGIGHFQSWLHGALGVAKPDLTDQMDNAFYPTLQAELGKDLIVNQRLTVHPFVGAEAGIEHLVQAGGDIVIGNYGQGGLLLRDDTTGQRYLGIAGTGSAMSLTLGGDVAHVFGSAYLPDKGAASASPTRTRLRAGLAWSGERASAFYGVTYLAPEFASQPQGQMVGSVNLNLRF
ncbi:MAG: DUF2219 family protein [Pseudorhodobacter sp.]|nr:DUF2219 family protein [Pseudorhodobacter sp.]